MCGLLYISMGQHSLEVKSVGSGDIYYVELNPGSTNH